LNRRKTGDQDDDNDDDDDDDDKSSVLTVACVLKFSEWPTVLGQMPQHDDTIYC
jgi:hypothetical protein